MQWIRLFFILPAVRKHCGKSGLCGDLLPEKILEGRKLFSGAGRSKDSTSHVCDSGYLCVCIFLQSKLEPRKYNIFWRFCSGNVSGNVSGFWNTGHSVDRRSDSGYKQKPPKKRGSFHAAERKPRRTPQRLPEDFLEYQKRFPRQDFPFIRTIPSVHRSLSAGEKEHDSSS